MRRASLPRRILASLLCVALLSWSSGCTAWVDQSQSPADVINRLNPDRVRVRRFSGPPVILNAPDIQDTVLVGYPETSVFDAWGVETQGWSGVRTHPNSIPLSDIRAIGIEGFGAAGSGVAAIASATILIVAVVAVMSRDGSGGATPAPSAALTRHR